MIVFLESRTGRILLGIGGIAVMVVLALLVARVVPREPLYAVLFALLVLGLGITATRPAAIAVATMPVLLWGGRIEGAGIDVSVSDVALFIATIAALVFTTRPLSPPMRTLLWLSALYQFATLFTVVANPSVTNTVEWFHAWMLVSGALLAGWTVGRAGAGRAGLTLFLSAALVIALAAIAQAALQYAGGDFAPVFPEWPFTMHKNFAGTVLGFAAITAYARPPWMGWSRGWALAAFWALASGVLVTQSRQAIMGLGIALLVIAIRRGQHRERSKMVVLVVAPALAFVGTLVRDEVVAGSEHSPVFQRLNWFQDTIAFWGESPWVGHGLRYWYRPGTLPFQPPNAELEVLASTGVIGLAAFLVLMVGSLLVLWRLDPIYGTLGVVVMLSRLVQSQFDLFWATAQVSIPFAIAGVCVGAAALAGERAELDRTRNRTEVVGITP